MTAYKTRQNALRDFDLDSLDAYEIRLYNAYIDTWGYSKDNALEAMINEVEGDYTQLSNDLAALAQEIEKL